jgi:AmmeMemoRadiSam system protein A
MSIISAYVVPHPPLILPEVGRGQERGIQATIDGFRRAAGLFAADRPDTVVLISPHAALYADYFHISPGIEAWGDMSAFGPGEPKTHAVYDREYAWSLEKAAAREKLLAGFLGRKETALDHGSVIPLRFFQEAYSDFKLVRIGLSGFPALEHYRLGQCIAAVAEELGRRTVIIASGDLSHKLKADGPYGFAPEGPEFDRRVMANLADGDFLALMDMDPNLCEAAAECGWRSFVMMAGAFDGYQVKAAQFSYEGPFGVGYGICAIERGEADESRAFAGRYLSREADMMATARAAEDIYVRAARYSMEEYVKNKRRLRKPGDLPPELRRELAGQMLYERAGAFVSLKIAGQLRGCIGTIGPTKPTLLEEILHNAVSAAAEDPRFGPVEERELERIAVSVDVLGNLEPVDSMDQLDVRRYGVIVSHGRRRGLLLPDLDGVETPAHQVEIALQKAGIKEGEPYQMERFEVVRHEAV